MFAVPVGTPLMFPNACGICKETPDSETPLVDTLIDREDFMGRAERIYVCGHCVGECLKAIVGDEPLP